MTMRQWFEVAAGSITGRQHVLTGKNNQDAYAWCMSDNALIAVVCDGCGSSKHSEVGAQLGARSLVDILSQQLRHTPAVQWAQVEQDLLTYLRRIADGLGEDMPATARDYLLFTIVGVFITSATTVFFALGDGVFAVNNTLTQLGPFVNNAPPYLAYRLLGRSSFPATMLSLRVQRCLPTAAVQSLLVGSDGLTALIQSAEHPMPGQQTPVVH